MTWNSASLSSDSDEPHRSVANIGTLASQGSLPHTESIDSVVQRSEYEIDQAIGEHERDLEARG